MLHPRLPIAGSRCRSRRVKPQHQAEERRWPPCVHCWPWSVLTCADSEVLPQKHPWKCLGWGHQVHSSTVQSWWQKPSNGAQSCCATNSFNCQLPLAERQGSRSCQQLSRSFSSFFLLAGIIPFLGIQSAEANWNSRSDLVTVWTITCHNCAQGVRGTGSLCEVWSLTNPLCHLWKTKFGPPRA